MGDQQAIRDFNRSIERTPPVALVLCTVLYVNMCGYMVSTSGDTRDCSKVLTLAIKCMPQNWSVVRMTVNILAHVRDGTQDKFIKLLVQLFCVSVVFPFLTSSLAPGFSGGNAKRSIVWLKSNKTVQPSCTIAAQMVDLSA